KRFERKGGRVAWGPLPEVMPDLGDIDPGTVRISITEGWPDSRRWLNQGEELPEEHMVWDAAEFLLPRLPARYDDWGLRQGWNTPVLVRLAADVRLPEGEHEFLLRGRGLGRLWIDGQVVARMKGKYRKTTNLEPIEPIAEPPMLGGRSKFFSQEEVVVTKRVSINNEHHRQETPGGQGAVGPVSNKTSPDGASPTIPFNSGKPSQMRDVVRTTTSRVVLEVIIGGAKLRTETTELTVACRYENQQSFFLLKPIDPVKAVTSAVGGGEDAGTRVPLTDAAIHPVLDRIETELVQLDNLRRRQAASGQNAFWEARHQVSRLMAEQSHEDQEKLWVERVGEATPMPSSIDQWVQYRIDQALFEATQHDAGVADEFHSIILPILREHCFRCHSEKAQGGLSLNQRHLALLAGDSGYPAIVPNDPDGSELIARVTDGDMPPG
ncbi:MAG: c-type cytochrome domain-containing protein, partial [Rubripirellula sp.]